MSTIQQFPAQQLPISRKGKEWRKKCVDAADSTLHFHHNHVRKSLYTLRINYDLMDGKLHMEDLALLCNPEGLTAEFIPTNILHYPIINSKLQVLRGEESKRLFDYKAIITNPNAISEIERARKKEMFQSLEELFLNEALSLEEFNENLEKLNDYYTYEWLDYREVRANCILKHYNTEYNTLMMFNLGFNDGMVVGEEIYQCDIRGGEPIIERVNPMKIRIFRSGYSNKVEDADLIILEDYWSLGKIKDTFHEVLTKKDIDTLAEDTSNITSGAVDNMGNVDERQGFINTHMMSDLMDSGFFFDPAGKYTDVTYNEMMPYDMNGNIRVLRVYWKSSKKIIKVKFFDEDGEEDFTFMPEDYVLDTDKGEEGESFWINEAWEGTKLGKDIYVNIGPRVVQYNRLTNPSRCHFGIVGRIYNMNDDLPFSMVDMMKPYSYLYDMIHDRLNKMMSRNWGKMARLDLSRKPKGWKIEKWLYYAKAMGLFIEDSFNEGTYGQSIGKLAGAMNSNSQGVIDADFGNNIQQYINLLDFIKIEMSDVAGISKQREGLISNRETVGGVERATLQSSHITEWLFLIHDDVKKAAMEAFLETAKVAFKGRTKKFWYILPDTSRKLIEIDGDEFAENDYGLVVDNSNNILDLQQKLETLALAALLNQTLSFSTIMKLFMSASFAEKQRMVEVDENKIKKQQEQMLQQQMQQLQLIALMQEQTKMQEMQFKDKLNQRDNETKITVAEINSLAEMAILQLKNHMTEMDKLNEEGMLEEEYSQEAKDKLMESMRLFDKKFELEREKLQFLKDKAKTDAELKRLLINKKPSNNR